jgi:hypothetical protein
MMKRNPDGTWRNTRRPIIVSLRVLRARWVEAEVLRLKTMGLSLDEIAEQITRVGRGKGTAIVAVPPGVTFPDDYSISRQGCDDAFKRAIARQPVLERDAYRSLDNARTEEMYLNLQPGIRKGNPRAIEAGIKVQDHSVKVNGYAAAPQRPSESSPFGDRDDRPTIATIRRIFKGAAVEVTPPQQPLITGVESGPAGSAAGGVASTSDNLLVPKDNGLVLSRRITMSDIESFREGLDEKRMRAFAWLLKI